MSTDTTKRRATSGRQRGFSLVEILVGVLIGMIGVVVIFQVLAVAEERKRNTTMGSDAQSSGAIGLYLLQRDGQLAGYGFGTAHPKMLGCTINVHDNGDTVSVPTVPARDFTIPFTPVLITQGALGAPDTITFLKGNPRYSIAHRDFKLVTAGDPTGAIEVKNGRIGLEWGNVVLMTSYPNVPPALGTGATGFTDCVLVQVTHRPATDTSHFGHQIAYDDPSVMLPYQQLPGGASTSVRFNKAGYPLVSEFPHEQGFVFDLGPQPRQTIWSIQNGKLITTEGLMVNTPPQEAADGIINLQAEYGIGIDNTGDGVNDVTMWTETTPDNTKALAVAIPACNNNFPSWRCVQAVRVALLARSAFYDKTACSPNPQWSSGVSGSLALTPFVMTNVDGGADTFGDCTENPPSPNNWRRYRYRVYEAVIPMRNMLWGSAPGVEMAGVKQ